MKLVKRVDFILFPIICSVFLLFGIFVYSDMERRTYAHYETITENVVKSAYQDGHSELKSLKMSMDIIENSTEFIRFINEQDRHYQAFSLNSSVYALIKRTLSDSSIHSFYVTDQNHNILIGFEKHGDPFSDSKLDHMPLQFVVESFALFNQGGRLSEKVRVESSTNGGYQAFISKSVSARLLSHDNLATGKNGYIAIFAAAELDTFKYLQQSLQHVFQPGFHYRLDYQPNADHIGQSHYEVERVDGDILSHLYFGRYHFQLTIPVETIRSDIQNQLFGMMMTTILAALASFLMLRLLIIRQIVAPIGRLTRTIRSTKYSHKIRLHPMQGDDEVSSLNNAYLALLHELQNLVSIDNLTGLANRRTFEHHLEQILASSQTNNTCVALLFIDLDNFKHVNDNFGHHVGDALLKEFAKQLNQIVDQLQLAPYICKDSMARLGGDEFAIALHNLDDGSIAEQLAKSIVALFAHGFILHGINHTVSTSIGITIANGRQLSGERLLTDADIAMYHAKSLGRNRYELHSEALAETLNTNVMIESELKLAVAQDLFELVAMPIHRLSDRSILGYEVLLRLPSLHQKGIGPEQFIPIAESLPLIHDIDQWVLTQALKQYRQLVDMGFTGFISINISAVELKNVNFVPMIAALTQTLNLSSEHIHLELTETRLVSPDPGTIHCLQQLRQLGFKISLDDFGTGYTAFSQLTHYPVDFIKIDRSFVNTLSHERHRNLIKIIMAIANIYDLAVIAEGIETQEQIQFLIDNGCNKGQGYELNKPMSWDDYLALLHAQGQINIDCKNIERHGCRSVDHC